MSTGSARGRAEGGLDVPDEKRRRREALAKLKMGPWTDYFQFAERVDALILSLSARSSAGLFGLKPLGGLLSDTARLSESWKAGLDDGEREALERILEFERSDPTLTSMLRDSTYAAAVRKARRRLGIPEQGAASSQQILLLRFHRNCAQAVGWYKRQKAMGWKPPLAGRRQVQKAAEHARELLILLEGGVDRHLPLGVQLDKRKLADVAKALEAISPTAVAPKDDKTLLEREFVRALAAMNLTSFRKPLSESIQEICSGLGHHMDESTIRQRVKEARKLLRTDNQTKPGE